MRLGTKILLLMLLITCGTSGLLTWIVSLNVTRYETRRVHEKISQTIVGYVAHLQELHNRIQIVVQALLEAPAIRSQIQAADEAGDTESREQLKQEILGKTVQTELDRQPGSAPDFQVIVNLGGEAIVAIAARDPALEKMLNSASPRWPVDLVVNSTDRLVSQYISTPAGLFLAMGVPIHTQFGDAPSHAYFAGFRVDGRWIHTQLMAGDELTSGDAPLSAWFMIDKNIVIRASSDPRDKRINSFTADTTLKFTEHGSSSASQPLSEYDSVTFGIAGENYLGHRFDLRPTGAKSGQLVLASSIDQALQPLRSLQRQIVLCTAIACLLAVGACRWLAHRIADPIQQLVAGTQRIAAGEFDRPVDVVRSDELGQLSDAFNKMSQGLKERDTLRDEKTKIERDLALARKIQMDVLPKHIPPCPGYDLAAYSLPAEQTGGDIYDLVALSLGNGQASPQPPALVLLLADATGHGVGPALSVTQVRSMLRMGVRLSDDLENVFAQINRQLCQDLGAGRFVTAFLGLLDPSLHCVNYHSAGQAPLLHYRAGDKVLMWYSSSMIPLGIEEEPQDEGVQRIALDPGDLLVLLTDGFYEFQNSAGQLFSTERVAEVITRNHDRSAKEILAEMLAATRSFGDGAPQLDDMTALIIKRLPAAGR